MNEKELQNFIYFLTHNKSLTRAQQKKRDALLARDLGGTTEGPTPPPANQLIHAPKETATFLSLFNRREGFKYLTHNYDNSMKLTDMLKQVKDVYEEGKRGKNLPLSLKALLHNFINGGEWFDAEGKKCADGYGNPDWISWSVNNEGRHPITNLGGMENTIQRFRHTVRVVAPDLEDYIKKIAERFPSLSFTLKKLDKADFYTNVFVLNSRLVEIVKDISDHESQGHHDIQVEYTFDISEDFFTIHSIRISHLDSYSPKSIEDVLRKYESTGGFFYENAEKLKGYCNWSVVSLWDGKPFRWNILDDTGRDKIETVETSSVIGFTHILTYYQKD